MSTIAEVEVSRIDRLKAMALKQPAKAASSSKSKVVEIHVPEIEKDTNAYPELKASTAWATDRENECEARIIAATEPRRLELSLNQHENLSSVRVNGLLYMCSPTHWAKCLNGARVAEVMEMFGERFDLYFEPRCKLKGKLSPAQQDALTAAGIEYSVEFVPTGKFHVDRTLDESVRLAAGMVPELPQMKQVRLK